MELTFLLKRRWLTALLAVIVLWGCVAGVFIVLGYLQAHQGRADINRARSQNTAAGLRDGSVEAQLRLAASHMKSAHGHLTNPVVQPWRLVPFVGRQITSAGKLAAAGEQVSLVGANSLHQAQALTEQAKTNRQATLTQLGTIASDANAQLAKIDIGPKGHLVGPLANARQELLTDVIGVEQGLQRASAGANGAAALFNDDANYLVFAANPAEMRSGSGMFLSAGTMTAGNGHISLGDLEDVGNYSVPNTSVTWPEDINKLWGFLQEKGKFQDLMLSPRFDASAPIAESMWKTSTKASVDGVMVVDPEMLKAILSATGPVSVDGMSFNADNVEQYLLFDQYKGLSAADNNSARRDVLSDVARSAFEALNEGQWDPITLAKNLAQAANGRHVFLYSNDEKLNQNWITAGVSGELDKNSMMLSVVNLGGNKLDQFLKVDSSIESKAIANGYDVTVTTRIANSAPTTGPQYVLGPFPKSGLKAGEYNGLLNFSLPGDATGVVFDGVAEKKLNEFLSGPDGPTQAIAVQTDLKPGESSTYVLHFYRSKSAQFTRVMPSARIPGSVWHYRNQTWTDDHSHFIFP